VHLMLPQNDEATDDRNAQLADSRDTYQYAHDWPVGVATLADLPKSQNYSLLYNLQVIKVYAAIGLNLAAMAVEGLDRGAIGKLIAERFATPSTEDLHKHIFSTPTELAKSMPHKPPESWREYEHFYEVWEKPAVASLYAQGGSQLDQAFAWQRVAGVNPMVLARCDAVPNHLAIDEALYARVMGDDSLAAAAAEHRLYLADYAALASLTAGQTDGLQKYIAAPMALFAVDKQSRQLRPVAIQLGQTPDAPTFAPSDGWRWRVALTHVQIADANMHEGVAHLGRTHMVMEAVNVAMRRQLAQSHPLHRLLDAHLDTTFAINASAKTSLIAPGGTVDRCFAGAIDSFGEVVKYALDSYPLDQASPLDDLARRGLDDAEALPHHPYRDDVKLVWGAVESYIGEYIDIYYASDADVSGDGELQAFVAEIGAQAGGRLKGVPSVQTLADAKAFISKLVFIAGPGHSAVNFPQYPFMGFPPNMTGASFAPLPTADMPDDEAELTKMLPPMHLALEGVTMIYVLSGARHSTFGHYDPFYFRDRQVGKIVRKLQGRLEEIEDVIEERDGQRLISYPFLRPSQILQSISI
jgi:arachidonate 15-lipoxygenase